jgi:O-methyltransferase involved in polyketide biosynthesis
MKLAPTSKKRVVKHTGADICILTAGLDSRVVRLTIRLQSHWNNHPVLTK